MLSPKSSSPTLVDKILTSAESGEGKSFQILCLDQQRFFMKPSQTDALK